MNSAPAYPKQSTGAKSGLIFIRDATDLYFQTHQVPASVSPVGLKYRSFTVNQNPIANSNRVVFIPGEFDGNLQLKPRAYGTLSRDTYNSTSVVNPRELVAWDRAFTISIWAAPQLGDVANEQASIGLVEDLLEQTVRAVNSASYQGVSIAASIVWGAVTIVSPPNESSFGTELLVAAIQRGPLFDVTLDVVQAIPAVTERIV